jgi:hypothetical protein
MDNMRARCLIAGLGALFASVQWCYPADCRISLQASDRTDGGALPGVEVVLTDTTRESVLEKRYTDRRGGLTFRDLDQDILYSVAARMIGFAPVLLETTCTLDNSDVIEIGLEAYTSVSFVQLLADPDAWDSRSVQVVGFLGVQTESTALYLHREDWKKAILRNAIRVSFPAALERQKRDLNKGYVLLEGRFEAPRGAGLPTYGGLLTEITRILKHQGR